MEALTSCFGLRRTARDDEREPLLPRYNDDTVLQRKLHQKLHTYQMLRALSQGYMPSTEQTITNLRTLLASDVLNPDNTDLSDSGRALVYYAKEWLKQFIELLQHKNSADQIQDFLWYLSKARLEIDMEDIARRATNSKAKADTAAAYKSLQTVGSLLLTNSDFRLFLSDLSTVGREVFKDTAFKLSEVSKDAGKKLEPSKEEQEALKNPGEDTLLQSTQDDLNGQVSEVTDVLAESASRVAGAAERSFVNKMQGDEKDTMLARLKQAITKLRKRNDYTDSVSTISLLLKRYAMVYSHVARDTVNAVQEDVDVNPETERAVKNFWLLIKSFGDPKQWDELEKSFKDVVEHGKADPQFDDLVRQLGNAVQDMLTDPSFFDDAEGTFQQLREKSSKLATGSSLRDDIDAFFAKFKTTVESVLQDNDISRLLTTSKRIAMILSPAHQYTNGDLIQDSINTFVPLIIQMIQYVPIPRVEVSTPEIDLLLENLVLEPGVTINHSSFLPYKLRVETYNDLEIRKARFRMTSAVKSLTTIKIDGISIRADELSFWLRAHKGLFRLVDEGIASFRLDERGIDIHLDIEIGKDRLDKIVSLRGVRVHIHKLTYDLRKSKFALLAWLFKPILKPIIRKTMEIQIASAIEESLHFLNRELLFARERLRATRISDPDDLKTFFKAVLARLTPPDDPDLYTRVGVAQPGYGVFKGRYAPGSIVKLWNEQADQAKQRIRENETDGWRNEIFDVHTALLT
ncbi:bactericidal permeability-increasing protein [Coniochaeta ligniaria NRRL 30616]|uniref:Bactericidal permeability-increasing protein n=1 Tax=Coniochaeta ligniaria NRRL 30616 TaxID=1408157 RepID=A0A1J7INM5_9PEZI|nr:bactericidal permeability-increasing protein [Coniochaeta ligniaria NRRL 30616]